METKPNHSYVSYTQGCHCWLDVKFEDFSRTFQDFFKQIQGPFVPKKLCYSVH